MKKIYPYIIVVVIAALAFFAYMQFCANKVAAPIAPPPNPPAGGQTPATPAGDMPTVSVAGMRQYTDTKFGFSFWYPDNWTVTVPVNPPFGAQLQGGTVVATLGLQPAGQAYPSIILKEFHSDTTSITDTGGAGPIGPITYYFDKASHLWMTTSAIADGVTDITKPADISNNSMGGLHLFGGTSRFDTNIIPLSAQNFVVMSDGGASNATVAAKTVVALDPAVATPVSVAEQIKTIEAEQSLLASEQR